MSATTHYLPVGQRHSDAKLLFRFLVGPMGWMHVLAIGGLFVFEARPIDWIVCATLYFVRMFGVTGGYHRYFSHRTYKTSRAFQFVLAFLAQSSSQMGALWWASHHRVHHKESDTDRDVHSPIKRSFLYSHILWIFDDNLETDYEKIRDMAKYPELVFLNIYWWVPPLVLGFGTWLVLGWSGLFVGFFLSTVLLWHGTFTINSLSHVFGYQDYESGDESKNNWVLALVTMGEGWHNNHHYYQASTRQGFVWWQVDVTYYVIKALELVGLVWDVREPPKEVVAGKRKLSHTQRAKGSANDGGGQAAA